MKLLVVSNYYPPFEIGGYELGCRDIVERLARSGHKVTVVTSKYGVGPTNKETGDVIRNLSLRKGDSAPAWRRIVDKLWDLLRFRQILRTVKPDLVYFWNLTGLTLQIVALTTWLGFPCAFFISDGSFISWKTGAFLCGWEKRSLLQKMFGKSFLVRGSSVIKGKPCHFASRFLADLAVTEIGSSLNQQVIHWGIDPILFSRRASTSHWPPTRFLLVGQVIPQKGIHTAIESFRLLLADKRDRSLTLSIVGNSSNSAYEARMHDVVRQHGLEGNIYFLGKRPREELPQIYASHDALIFPSEWEEPFAITPLEAMAAGLPVIGTITGGSGELFEDGKTALVFVAGDANSCAAAVRRLRTDEEVFNVLRREGTKTVISDFTLESMATKIEKALARLVR